MNGRYEIFRNKIVVITGGSNGIGRSLANKFAIHGASVWLLARREGLLMQSLEGIKQASKTTSQQHGYVVCDVADITQVESAINQVIDGAGLPDILVNCAGVVHPGRFLDLDLEKFHWMMDINYFGPVHCMQALLPKMIERGSGHIVNISSMAAVIGIYGYTAYAPSKSAVLSISEALHTELKPKGINITVVLPADTDTDQLHYEENYRPIETKAITSFGTVHSPESVADEIIKGVSRNKFLILPGFDAKLLYWGQKILGNGLFLVFDLLIWWARSKKRKV